MTLRVVQVNCVIDAERRDPEALLAAWPTMAAIATATQRAGATVTVLQASHAPAEYRRDDVTYMIEASVTAATPQLGIEIGHDDRR